MNLETLNKDVKNLTFVTINGNAYLGNVENVEGGGVKLTNAVKASDNFDATIKKWIKDANLNQLESLEVEGIGATYAKSGFNEKQLMQIDIITAQASFAIKYALANLQNGSF
jgi:hypothetical protein